MFPTASSQVYYNEDGEVLGWDTVVDYGPDQDDYYDLMDAEPEWVDPEDCDHPAINSGRSGTYCAVCDADMPELDL